ncbi:response regulator transcription factor [Slackia exigua]|uniref:response regulator transcription factor n=1 Tax=Slackia exigua TaxID=84109 RepID=UPI00210AB6A6|nr:response regulator transcription factor [Slackia exigua]MCQ5092273.1 response regulator transcription factor [Slackia exigua]
MKLVIVDDDPIVRESLGIILDAQADIEVVAFGSDGDDAVRLFEEHAPDVLLSDIRMSGRDGLSAAEELLRHDPEARVVFLTTFSDDEYIVRALKMGARGYLIKQDVASIAPALRAVMAGQNVLEGEVLERAAFMADGVGGSRTDESALSSLTEREREVVRAVAEGLDNAEAADALCMSEGTLRNHISSVLAKLGLRNRTQIAVFYYRRCAGRG